MTLQTLIPGLTVVKLSDDLIVLTASSSSQSVIDAFSTAIHTEQADWPADRIGYFVFDFAQSFAAFNTPYGRKVVDDLTNWRPELRAFTAIIVPKSHIFAIARPIIDRVSQRRQGSLSRIFFSRDDGLHWLRAQMILVQQGNSPLK